jgi:hypothetical protein
MVDKITLLDIIHNFEQNPFYKFGLEEYNIFVGPENQNMIYIVLTLQEYTYNSQSLQTVITDIKSRIKNLLSLGRVILKCNINTELF